MLSTHEAPAKTPSMPLPRADVRDAVQRACARIAPTWPLDRFIAVNPLWERTAEPLPTVAAELAALSGARLLMPRGWYAEAWREGRLRREHLRAAVARAGANVTEERLVSLLEGREPAAPRRALVADVLDARAPEPGLSWRELVVQRTSQLCASYFDEGQALLTPSKDGGLYATWRRSAAGDFGPGVLKGSRGFRAAVAALPERAEDVPGVALAELGVPEAEHERYLAALLLDVNGWASWCAFLRWQARLEGRDDGHLAELLAIRLAWELVLFRSGHDGLEADWRRAMAGWPAVDRAAQLARADDWLLQDALELAHQASLAAKLETRFAASRPEAPRVQAVFCIDVRSEVFRRAFEARDPGIQTLGFAGFFGLPIEYAAVGAEHARPQLPGLLAPKLRVTEGGPDGLASERRARLQAGHAWKTFRGGGLSSFAFVEAVGLFAAAELLEASRAAPHARVARHERAGLAEQEAHALAPRLSSAVDGTPLSLDARVALAEGMLRGMSLTRGFAPLVLLVGHGSQTRNNPHAAGLDCGACGGQTGEVNARAAAALLNEPEVRERLAARGIDVPVATRFVAALHDTTTDEVTVFDVGEVPGLDEAIAQLRHAGAAARRERAPSLGLGGLGDDALHAAVQSRARNWAEVRPEWGLAGNASFIVAPRERTRGLDLGGRSFLHEYRFEEDRDGSVLELIMTAPMVVTHWINFQYYASTVDNERYGSGNKVLHNVVGGRLGVFEGNGGDLRIGLPLQSLHDGTRWVHEPLRLSVFIEAPADAIDRVLAKHARVRQLVEGRWLHLFQLDRASATIRQRHGDGWSPVAPR